MKRFVSSAIRRAAWLHLPATAVGFAACGGSIATDGQAHDGGTLLDTGLSYDASSIQDAAGPDTNLVVPEAGPPPDAGHPADASPPPDSGPHADAEPFDALPVDAVAVCEVTSPTPVDGGLGGPCNAWQFSFSGSSAECGADAGVFSYAQCQQYCPRDPADAGFSPNRCTLSDGLLTCYYGICGTGRRPAGLRSPRPARARHPVARFLARSAHLEAASVHAFDHLARELDAHGAPPRLRSLARRCARDEVRHARTIGALAERAGARVPAARVSKQRVRSLEAVAIENAVEGCVAETFGAAVATVQAGRALSPEVRSAMARISRDETRHAELSWAVAAWLDTRLDDAAKARVRRARDGAVRRLLRSVTREPPRQLVRTLGLPTADEALAVATDLAKSLWT
jgi:hypothetical protein